MVKPFYTDSKGVIYCGDSLEVLKTLPSESVNCVITSPPYWGLRDYGTATWEGGDPNCEHEAEDTIKREMHQTGATGRGSPTTTIHISERPVGICVKCGAKSVDKQLGLEPSFEEYISKLCDIFDEVKRVLRKDGTCWVNIGDTYNSSQAGNKTPCGLQQKTPEERDAKNNYKRYKASVPDKCLCQIPARFALEMTDRGWILRNTIIWYKRNCMPSSVEDRFTVDYEFIYFFVKNKRYYFEQQLEPHKRDFSNEGGGWVDGKFKPKNSAWMNDPLMERGRDLEFRFN